MKRFFLLCMLLVSMMAAPECKAQPSVGSLVPDWTYKDITGVSHNLYSYLDSGYMVILDFSATWCSPCWAFHNSHVAEALTNHYGPNGTIIPKKIKFIFFEADRFTDNDDLHGNTSASQGDWVTGTNYPIIDTSGISTSYSINAYPTFVSICPSKRVNFAGAGNAGVAMESLWVDRMNACPLPSATKDVALISLEDTVNLCANTVLMQNMWNQPLTSAALNVFNGSTLVTSYPWTGSLPPYGVTPISLPAGTIATGQGDLTFKLQVPGDANQLNDTVTSAFDLSSLSANKIRIVLKTDRYPYETSWTLLNGNAVIAYKEYGFADTNQTFTYDYTVGSGACLRFVLYDSYADGISGGTSFTTVDDGYAKIYDGVTNTLLASVSGKEFSKQFVRHYRAAGTPSAVNESTIDASVNIFPNPADGNVTIAYSGIKGDDVLLTVTDITGRAIHAQTIARSNGQAQEMQLSVQHWPAGIYMVSLRSGDSRITRKLEIIH